MKEAVFHPEARAEVSQSVEFYEARLNGLGLRFLSAVEQTAERISASPEAGPPLFQGFRIVSSIVFGKTTCISLLLPTNTAARTTGASERTAANSHVDPTV